MDMEIIIVNEENQIERDKYHMISLICGIKKIQMNLLQNRNRLTDLEKKFTIMGEGAGVGVGID